ncbi:uncharacterized protein LOC142556900 [Primulina tabacum]|uniref:uncharacterized protein LOC142556900 n=1 Tax=Primulina tabacum TaxID=48773 RepID=UPI003F5AAAAA
MECTSGDKKKTNLDNVSNYILYKTMDKNTSSKIKMYLTAKDIWDKLIQLCELNEQTKENKFSMSIQKFDSIKMKVEESMSDFDERVTSIIIEMSALGKEYGNREITSKIVKALPRE